MASFLDVAICPKGHRFAIYRMGKSAGKIVATYCTNCRKFFQAQAGKPKPRDAALDASTKEKP